jgi:hypothetical protein
MNHFLKFFLLFGVATIFISCKNNEAVPKQLGLRGDKSTVESCQVDKRYNALQKENSDVLNAYLNLAGFAYQKHNYRDSNRFFDKAIEKYRYFENKGVISASRTLSYIIASFLNDTHLDYEGDGYEKVMMHNYKAINYLMLDDKESARVEIRNSYQKQMEEKEKFRDEIAEYKKKDKEVIREEQKLPRKKRRYRRSKKSIYAKLKPLFEGVSSEHMPYQNPFAYYVSALVYEENGEFNDAYIDIKEASKYYPDSQILKEKLLYYARKAHGKDSDQYKSLLKNSGLKESVSDKRAEIFISFSSSPIKEQMKVPIYVNGAMQFVSFPTFRISKNPANSVLIRDDTGATVAKSSILTDVDAIVINIFKERVLGMILRQVVNVGAKTVASEAIANKIDTGNVLVGAAVGLGVSLVSAITSKADTRTWSTLPAKIDALSFSYDSSKKYTLHLLDKSGNEISKQPLVLKKQKSLKNSYTVISIKGNEICK